MPRVRSVCSRVHGLAVGAVLLAAAAFGGAPAQEPAAAPLRVLFIGNSLTAANDLPRLVETVAAAEGGPRLECVAVTAANRSLEDHWRGREATRAIRRGGWSTVVLQQGPSALEESRLQLVDYTERFASEARRVGARTALYMVWPARARSGDFERVSASYAAAARAVGGLLLPVGDAWNVAWRLDPHVALYGPDGFHPSRLGSVLAAVVIVRGLSARRAEDGPPRGLDAPAPPWARSLGLDEPLAVTLDRAAAMAQGGSPD